MPRLNPGVLQTWVTLSDEVQDGTPVTFVPDRVKAGIQASAVTEGLAGSFALTLRYHPQITLNTCVTLDDGTRAYVREIGNKANADRSGWMTLRCEEAEQP